MSRTNTILFRPSETVEGRRYFTHNGKEYRVDYHCGRVTGSIDLFKTDDHGMQIITREQFCCDSNLNGNGAEEVAKRMIYTIDLANGALGLARDLQGGSSCQDNQK